MPAPMMSIFFGRWRSSRAPVESTMRGSSGRKGSLAACEPAAMMALLNRTVLRPSFVSTTRSKGPEKAPTPVSTVTLRPFAMLVTPPLSLPTTLSLKARSLSRSTCGSPKDTPWTPKSRAASMMAAV